MWQYAVKIFVTSIIIVAVSEIAKRNSFWAAILASLPLTSLLAFIWMYIETGDTKQIATLSQGIFWLVIPSLALFLLLPVLLRIEWNFWLSLVLSCVATASAYYLMVWLLARLGIKV